MHIWSNYQCRRPNADIRPSQTQQGRQVWGERGRRLCPSWMGVVEFFLYIGWRTLLPLNGLMVIECFSLTYPLCCHSEIIPTLLRSWSLPPRPISATFYDGFTFCNSCTFSYSLFGHCLHDPYLKPQTFCDGCTFTSMSDIHFINWNHLHESIYHALASPQALGN